MRRSSRCLRCATLTLVLLGLPVLARAEDATLSAREHFARGYAFADGGDANAAIREFELAYAASPNPSVLYNLGQAYAAAGRSSEAIDTLGRYLKLSGSSLTEARARQVEALISYHAQRVGQLELEVDPPDSALVIDGRASGSGSRTVPLNAGAHSVVASAAGFELTSVRVEVAARETTPLKLRLERRADPALLVIACALGDVSVFVDGTGRGRTPEFGGSPLSSGTHRVRFERPGYLPDEQRLLLPAGSTRNVACRLSIDPADPNHGRLAVRHPEGTRVFLDDAPFHGSNVPRGKHRVRISGPGYTTESQQIELLPREHRTLTWSPALDARALSAAHERTRSRVRIGSYVAAGVGVATAATAAVIYIDNSSRYATWQAKSRHSVSSLPNDPNAGQALDALLAEENGIRKRDSLALGLTVFSCAALATSAVLFLSSREAEQRLILTAGAEPSLRYEQAF